MRGTGGHLSQSVQRIVVADGRSGRFRLPRRRLNNVLRARYETDEALGEMLLLLSRDSHPKDCPGNRCGYLEFLLEQLGIARIVKLEGDCPNRPAITKQRHQLRTPGAELGVQLLEQPAEVIVGVEDMTLEHLASQARNVVEKARAGKLENIGLGVFTVTNLGMFGIEEFAAIINPPESAILAVGAVREDVVVRKGSLRAGRVMSMTLSADHRIVDGVVGAKFLARVKEQLEDPGCLLS